MDAEVLPAELILLFALCVYNLGHIPRQSIQERQEIAFLCIRQMKLE